MLTPMIRVLSVVESACLPHAACCYLDAEHAAAHLFWRTSGVHRTFWLGDARHTTTELHEAATDASSGSTSVWRMWAAERQLHAQRTGYARHFDELTIALQAANESSVASAELLGEQT